VDQIGASNLKQVQLIGHSAGSWAVYSALRYIAAHAPGCEVQVTYLDPFIPDQTSYNLLPLLNHAFKGQVLEQSVNYTKVTTPGAARAEAYFTEFDETELSTLVGWPSEATSVTWSWSGIQGAYVQEMYALDQSSPDWYGHGGPIAFYRDSIATPGASRIESLGWNNSLAFNTTVERAVRLTGNLASGDVIVGGSSTCTFTIHNDGNDDLTVSAISLPAGFTGNWFGKIAVGSSHDVAITFSPTAAQEYSGTVTVSSDATSGTGSMAVYGRGVARVMRLAGDLDFGNVMIGSSVTRVLKLANDGNTAMSVVSIVTPAGFSGAWSGNIAAGGAQDVLITFSPTTLGQVAGTLAIDSDATSGMTSRDVTGSGVGSLINLSGNLSFGAVEVATTASGQLSIRNNGNIPMNVSGLALPVGYSGNWSGTILPSSVVDVAITFTPTIGMAYSGVVTVLSDANGGTATYPIDGLGTVSLSQDSDGDGVTDQAELLAGTDKNDKSSFFHVAKMRPVTGGGVELTWASVSGRRYNVMIATNLASGYAVLASGLNAAPPENRYTDSVQRASAFYKLEVFLDP
ncbi:MAG: choice-of-anchor D domain-containing protein, partial [bacterium]